MVGQQMTFTLNATDNVSIDSERLWLSIDGKDIPVLKNVAYCTPLTKGTHAAYASVYDAAGNVDDTLFNFYAQYTDIDSVNPVAEITSPYDTTIYNSIYVSGSATHSAGQSIAFQRDSMNRITSVTDNSGRGVQYLYDGLGNLQKVINPSGAVTRFKYGPDHYLQEIIDPRGVRATRVEYDQDGRMVRQISPAGDTLAFNHDPANNREILKILTETKRSILMIVLVMYLQGKVLQSFTKEISLPP